MSKYDIAYKQLNPEQKRAVELMEGPLLVVAGPGTGKTQLLSVRTANILKTTDTSPSSILCLTFTNSAAQNLKSRIIELAGNEGQGVVVKTFHSFASEIMNLHPDKFWNAARLDAAPEAVQLQLIREVVGKLPLKNPLALKFAGQFTLIKDIQEGLTLTKEAGLTPEKLQVIIANNLGYIDTIEAELTAVLEPRVSAKFVDKIAEVVADLPDMPISDLIRPLQPLSEVIKQSWEQAYTNFQATGKTTPISLFKSKWTKSVAGVRGMVDERKRNQWWLALADVYAKYRKGLHEAGYYDFADMVVEVLKALESDPELLADVQERFLYVMIDEFQDTNEAQMRLAHFVSDHYLADGKPNIMAVGDDDQSIFKFQGADINNMLSFKRSYPSAEIIVLTDNYRSSQVILDTASKVIEQAQYRLVTMMPGLSKELKAQDKEHPPSHKASEDFGVNAICFDTRETENYEIARLISEEQKNSPDRSIAVLARNHQSLTEMSAILLSLNTPVKYERRANILEHDAITQTIAICKTVQAIKAGNREMVNALLANSLYHPMWKLEPKKLWQLALHNHRDWLTALEDHPPSHKASEDFAREKGTGEIADWLTWLTSQLHEPGSVVLEYILGLRVSEVGTSPLPGYFWQGKDTNFTLVETLSAIQRLRALVVEYSKHANPKLDKLIEFVDLNIDSEVVIADETPFVSAEHAVELMTVYKAKGREFDSVYIINATDKNWTPAKNNGRKPPANLPLQRNGDDFEDYIRLLYVAITRAKASVTVSSHNFNSAGEEILTSSIVVNSFGKPKQTASDPGSVAEVLTSALTWPRLENSDELVMLGGTLENYQLSVTHLLNFLDVSRGGPNYFLKRNLLHLPEVKSERATFGSAIHSALEIAQLDTNTGKFTQAKVLEAYNIALLKENLPEHEQTRYLEQGEAVLRQLFGLNNFKLEPGGQPERKIDGVHSGQARLSGKLDRLETTDDQLLITDYKTGKPLMTLYSKASSEEGIKAWKHRTQLIFYALLVRRSQKFKQSKVVTQMLYTQAEFDKDLIKQLEPTAEQVADLDRLVQVVWKHIMELDLPDTSKYEPNLKGIEKFIQDLLAN